MTEGEALTLAFKIVMACALAAFAPPILRWLHKIGYRDWREKPKKDTPETR